MMKLKKTKLVLVTAIIIGGGLAVGLGAGLGAGLKSSSTPNESISFSDATYLASTIVQSAENRTNPYFLPNLADGVTSTFDGDLIPLFSFAYDFSGAEFNTVNFELSIFIAFKNEGESSDSNIPLGTELWTITYDNTTTNSQNYVLSLTFTGTVDSVLYIGAGLPSSN